MRLQPSVYGIKDVSLTAPERPRAQISDDKAGRESRRSQRPPDAPLKVRALEPRQHKRAARVVHGKYELALRSKHPPTFAKTSASLRIGGKVVQAVEREDDYVERFGVEKS